MGKLVWLLTSIVLIGMSTSIIAIFWATMNDAYGSPSDGMDLSTYDKLDEIHTDITNLKAKSNDIDEEEGSSDRLGNFFSNAYSMLASIPKSFNIILDMINYSLIDLQLGESGYIISISMQTILIIFVVVGILLAILLKVVL